MTILRNGGYVETAAAAAGISKDTFYEWLKRGDPEGKRPEDAPYRDFRERVEQARAEGEARAVEIIAQAALEDWRAAAWMLERQYPDRWGGPRGRRPGGAGRPSGRAGGEQSVGRVVDDQVGPDGQPL